MIENWTDCQRAAKHSRIKVQLSPELTKVIDDIMAMEEWKSVVRAEFSAAMALHEDAIMMGTHDEEMCSFCELNQTLGKLPFDEYNEQEE